MINRMYTTCFLWEKITELPSINPDEPIGPDVVKVLNVLEMVAACWDADVLKKNVMQSIFAEQYLDFYYRIRLCDDVLGKSGRAIVDGSKLITKMVKHFQALFPSYCVGFRVRT